MDMKPGHKEYIPDKRKTLLSVVMIIALGFAVYANSIKGDFVYDDHKLVKENVYIKGPTHISKIFTENTGAGAGGKLSSYRPLQILSYMLDYRIWRLDVRGYHLSNILWHVAMALAVYWFIHILYKDPLLPLLTGLLFVVHPAHTEAVSYISGRADLLSGIFMMLCIIFYVKEPPCHKNSFFVLMLLTYALALLSRENSLILPALLLIYHSCFHKEVKAEKFLPILVLAGTYAALRLTVFRFRAMLSVEHISTTVWERLTGFFVALLNYLRLLVLPFDLHMEYGKVNGMFPGHFPQAVLGIIVVCVLSAYIARKRNTFLMFCALWFFVALLPVSNIFPVNAYMAEHWLYVPSIGFFIIVAKAICVGATGRSPLLRKFTGVIVICLLGYFSYLTIRQNHYWSDPAVFYERTLKYNPDNVRMINNLAKVYLDRGRQEDAVAMMKRCIKIRPRAVEGYNNLGSFYRDLGRNEEAVAVLKKALEINPEQKETHNNLGLAYAALGRLQEAIGSYQKAISLRPDYAKAYNNLANLYSDLGRLEEAIAAYKKAVEIDPDFAQSYFNLSVAYFRNQQYKLAVEYFDKAGDPELYDPAYAKALEPYR
ncbi:MAG: tetratricopeptide repeat protein [Candidatus Omnitrophica bacterium]|nr:tetratricopeptide repeat protein [Candidatus Omnitrophota bacterium]